MNERKIRDVLEERERGEDERGTSSYFRSEASLHPTGFWQLQLYNKHTHTHTHTFFIEKHQKNSHTLLEVKPYN